MLGEPAADLRVSVSTAPTSPSEGADLVYTLTVVNDGPDAASGVELTQSLPENVTFQSAPGCTGPSAGVLTCAVGGLANAGQESFTVTVTTLAAGIVNSTVEAAAATLDPDSANNTAVVERTVLRDTDGDGLADVDDADDDNDGYSDEAERAAGSDPLDPDSVPARRGLPQAVLNLLLEDDEPAPESP